MGSGLRAAVILCRPPHGHNREGTTSGRSSVASARELVTYSGGWVSLFAATVREAALMASRGSVLLARFLLPSGRCKEMACLQLSTLGSPVGKVVSCVVEADFNVRKKHTVGLSLNGVTIGPDQIEGPPTLWQHTVVFGPEAGTVRHLAWRCPALDEPRRQQRADGSRFALLQEAERAEPDTGQEHHIWSRGLVPDPRAEAPLPFARTLVRRSGTHPGSVFEREVFLDSSAFRSRDKRPMAACGVGGPNCAFRACDRHGTALLLGESVCWSCWVCAAMGTPVQGGRAAAQSGGSGDGAGAAGAVALALAAAAAAARPRGEPAAAAEAPPAVAAAMAARPHGAAEGGGGDGEPASGEAPLRQQVNAAPSGGEPAGGAASPEGPAAEEPPPAPASPGPARRGRGRGHGRGRGGGRGQPASAPSALAPAVGGSEAPPAWWNAELQDSHVLMRCGGHVFCNVCGASAGSARIMGLAQECPARRVPGWRVEGRQAEVLRRLRRGLHPSKSGRLGSPVRLQACGRALDEGIPVEACFDGQAPRRSLLRMDRRLSQLELWPAEGLHGEPPAGAWVVVPLRQTGPVAKGDADQTGDNADARAVVVHCPTGRLRLVFDSARSRDRTGIHLPEHIPDVPAGQGPPKGAAEPRLPAHVTGPRPPPTRAAGACGSAESRGGGGGDAVFVFFLLFVFLFVSVVFFLFLFFPCVSLVLCVFFCFFQRAPWRRHAHESAQGHDPAT
ncbi:unnamed protein product [Prorocentrum cordatum]|uniref:Uncharacterized protein n=1 Tax=Prorocentrum cordatum TaxID=2364126 RepID=A0ABN9VGI8_9DINO|nr:unnamed protein product [Polarella glacialis]